jgi:hypothetical protein
MQALEFKPQYYKKKEKKKERKKEKWKEMFKWHRCSGKQPGSASKC